MADDFGLARATRAGLLPGPASGAKVEFSKLFEHAERISQGRPPSRILFLLGRHRFVSEFLSVYFFPAGVGQSILVELPGNRWVVVDACLTAIEGRRARGQATHHLPALERLERASKVEGFRVLAVVITHLHEDHYRGIPQILEFIEDLPDAEGWKELVVLLPGPHQKWVQIRDKLKGSVRFGELEKFLWQLNKLKQEQRGRLRCRSFAWKAQPGASLTAQEPWIFCFHPDNEEIYEEMLDHLADGPLDFRQPGAEFFSHRRTNGTSCVLGTGIGDQPEGLHVLLTADITGTAFAKLTRELSKLLPDLETGKVGTPQELHALIDRSSSENLRLRRVSALSVPHHGSGRDPALAQDLGWWLHAERPKDLPTAKAKARQQPVAVIQGSGNLVKADTLEELHEAGLRIFASSRPLDSEAGEWEPAALRRRLLESPEVYTSEVGEAPSYQPRQFVVRGNGKGIQTVENDGFFELRRPPVAGSFG